MQFRMVRARGTPDSTPAVSKMPEVVGKRMLKKSAACEDPHSGEESDYEDVQRVVRYPGQRLRWQGHKVQVQNLISEAGIHEAPAFALSRLSVCKMGW